MIPKFVFKWLKETGSGYLRGGDNFNIRVQDGPAYKMLCAKCEQSFGNEETFFASRIFYPIVNEEAREFAYDERFFSFVVSVIGGYNLTVYYTTTHDLFTNVTQQDNIKNLFYTSYQNLGLSSNLGSTLTAAFHPAAWWDMNFVLDGFYQHEASKYLQGSYNRHNFSYDGMMNQSFMINKNC
ncbi:outer membrane beta-barrel protein [Mucilaginibacter polytrichastri]|nr:outer membrane beta-barrel protein [Mucilaginibacter polytrichastri]